MTQFEFFWQHLSVHEVRKMTQVSQMYRDLFDYSLCTNNIQTPGEVYNSYFLGSVMGFEYKEYSPLIQMRHVPWNTELVHFVYFRDAFRVLVNKYKGVGMKAFYEQNREWSNCQIVVNRLCLNDEQKLQIACEANKMVEVAGLYPFGIPETLELVDSVGANAKKIAFVIKKKRIDDLITADLKKKGLFAGNNVFVETVFGHQGFEFRRKFGPTYDKFVEHELADASAQRIRQLIQEIVKESYVVHCCVDQLVTALSNVQLTQNEDPPPEFWGVLNEVQNRVEITPCFEQFSNVRFE